MYAGSSGIYWTWVMSMTRSRRASSKMPGKYSSAVQILEAAETIPAQRWRLWVFGNMVLKSIWYQTPQPSALHLLLVPFPVPCRGCCCLLCPAAALCPALQCTSRARPWGVERVRRVGVMTTKSYLL